MDESLNFSNRIKPELRLYLCQLLLVTGRKYPWNKSDKSHIYSFISYCFIPKPAHDIRIKSMKCGLILLLPACLLNTAKWKRRSIQRVNLLSGFKPLPVFT